MTKPSFIFNPKRWPASTSLLRYCRRRSFSKMPEDNSRKPSEHRKFGQSLLDSLFPLNLLFGDHKKMTEDWELWVERILSNKEPDAIKSKSYLGSLILQAWISEDSRRVFLTGSWETRFRAHKPREPDGFPGQYFSWTGAGKQNVKAKHRFTT